LVVVCWSLFLQRSMAITRVFHSFLHTHILSLLFLCYQTCDFVPCFYKFEN
jgi:hypothetical protein